MDKKKLSKKEEARKRKRKRRENPETIWMMIQRVRGYSVVCGNYLVRHANQISFRMRAGPCSEPSECVYFCFNVYLESTRRVSINEMERMHAWLAGTRARVPVASKGGDIYEYVT